MADQSRRTTILLTVVAILFIITIIILCLPYDIGHKKHPSKEKIQSDEIHTSSSTTKYPTTRRTTAITSTTQDPVTRRTSSKETTTIPPSTTTSTDIVSKSISTTSTLSSILSTSSPTAIVDTTSTITETTLFGQTDSTGTSVTGDAFQNYSTETTTKKHLSSTETTTKYYLNRIGETETTTIVTDETTTLQDETPTPTVVETEAPTTPVITTPTTTTTTTTTPATTTPVITIPMVTTIDPFLEEPECNKTECKDFSAKMWLLRDKNADPCEDFYQYACGAIVDSPSQTPVDAGEAVKRKIQDNILNADNEAYVVARDFYTSCLHQSPVQAGKQWKDTSDWMDQQIPTITSCDKDELTTILAQLLKNNFAPLFDISLGLDGEDRFVARVTPPILRYPFSDDIAQQYCIKQYKLDVLKESQIDVEQKYEEYLNCTADGIGMEARLYYLDLNLRNLEIQGKNITETIDFFKNASELKIDPFTSEDLLQLDYQFFDLDSVNILSPQINWDKLLSELFNMTNSEGMQIQMYRYEYIQKIDGLLSQQPACEILGTLWKESRYMDLVSPQSTLTPYSEEYCLDLTTSLLPELLYSIDEAQLTNDTIVKVSESIWTMKNTTGENRDRIAKNQALQFFNQTQSVNNTFNISGNHTEIMSASNYQMKSLLLLQRLRSELYNQLFDNYVDDQDHYLYMYRALENAAFHPEEKYYSGASYILEEPYYTEYEPAYLRYPGLGGAMERTAFRNKQEQDTDSFCEIQEEFRGYKDSNITLKVNLDKMKYFRDFSKMVWDGYNKGKYLASENITEYLGQRDFAPLPWFEMTPEKLFYLRSAQIHCEATSELDLLAVKERGHIPGPIRVNKILMNERGFRRAFECPPQERIRTEDMCTGH